MFSTCPKAASPNSPHSRTPNLRPRHTPRLDHRGTRLWRLPEELLKAQVFPHGFLDFGSGTLDAEGGVLVGHHVVLVVRIDGLVLWCEENFVGEERLASEFFKEVDVPDRVEVQLGARGIERLGKWVLVMRFALCA